MGPFNYYNSLGKVVVVSDDDVWAVGAYYDVNYPGGHQNSLILHWDGTVWRIVPHPAGGPDAEFVDVAAVSSNDVWAVGDASGPTGLIEHWDGTKWSVVPAADPGTEYWHFQGVAAAGPDDVWAVGDTATGRSGGTLVEHWDGKAWSIVPSPSPEPEPLTSRPYPGLEAVAVVSADDVWAVGEATNVAPIGGSNTLIEHWDGRSWSVVASPDVLGEQGTAFDYFSSVAASSANDVWAVGDHGDKAVGGNVHGLIEHWDGTSWQVVNPPTVGASSGFSGVAASGDGAWAVGGSTSGALIEHWDGSTWNVVDSQAGPKTGLGGVAVAPSGERLGGRNCDGAQRPQDPGDAGASLRVRLGRGKASSAGLDRVQPTSYRSVA